MNLNQETKMSFKKGNVSGESWVWVTAMGLTIGIAMIAALLGLIGFRGVQVFWPKPVVLLQVLPENASGVSGDTQWIAGVITKRQERKVHRLHGESAVEEIQVFQGNKDVYGASFLFLDSNRIANETYPKEVMRVERMEYGDAIAFPVKVSSQSGLEGLFGTPEFDRFMNEWVGQSRALRNRIKKIEKDEIGKINYAIDEKAVRLRVLNRKSASASSEAQSLEEQISQLKVKYEKLAQTAQELRGELQGWTFVYRTASGEEKSLSGGNVVSYYYPNRLTLMNRLWIFYSKIQTFLTEDPREANTEGGVFPAIFGTFVMTIMMSVFVTPFGVLAAIYLREYATQGPLVRTVRIAVNNLAGVPSIVFGVFGVGFFVYFLGGSIDQLFFADRLPTPTYGTGGILWAALTLALLTVPVVIVATEESLASVPKGMREGSLACGASKWQTIQRVVLPASAPGILTGLILAMARGASEVAPLMLVGVVKLAPNLPLDNIFPFVHFDRKFMHLGFHIYDLGFQSPDSEAAKPMVFATTLLLIGLVMVLNLSAIWIREHLRKKYVVGAF